MTIFQAIFLGIVQGLTEFIPVSSSAHLVIVPYLFNWKFQSVCFDVSLHFGTLIALVIYFRKEILKLFFSPNYHLLSLILIATIPAAIIGLSFKNFFESIFENVLGVSFFLIITSILLFLAEKKYSPKKSLKELTTINSLQIGFAQALAILPGISRSGATISSGLFLGLDRDSSFKFAFLISMPAIFGATIIKFKDSLDAGFLLRDFYLYLLGTLSSLIVGYFSLIILYKVMQRGKLKIFAYYCIFLALFTLSYKVIL